MACFSDLSKECDMEGCRNHDFLPYKCEYCKLIFCEFHRNAEEHLCSKLKDMELNTVVLCEYCGIVLPDKKEDIQNHLIYKCLYKKKTKSILMCNKRDCKKVLNGINNYICKKCRKSFCLPHRYSDVHNCIKSDEEKSFFKSNIKKNKYILKVLFQYIFFIR
ncbi:hypothetical protein PFLG_01054 [Plasmodium falciparum RAJ116]|uniref:AN1-type domain-containing protein n=3 Tax=Plasmodium falciparum TaxID=5833 RepID=A0A0L0CUQ3_PLAFA|nr:hypothetical protein PFNF135_01020 [Plasmodium falciparum NF135/5.C10]KNC36185.1 hypothetical protein PFLG_01054 [Plasmodium falciparum RAJ116]